MEAADLAVLLKALGAYPAHVVGHSYGAYTALILAMKHPELVRSLVLAEPPLLRWLPDLPGGQRLYGDFMDNMWDPTGREFRQGNTEQAMRLTIDWFGKNGYLIEGKPARFDALSGGNARASSWRTRSSGRLSRPPRTRSQCWTEKR